MQSNPPHAAPIDSMKASGLQHVLIYLELAVTFAEMASTSRAAGQWEAARRNVAQAEMLKDTLEVVSVTSRTTLRTSRYAPHASDTRPKTRRNVSEARTSGGNG